MAKAEQPALSVADLFAQKEARRRQEKAAEEQLKRKQREELSDFKRRLDEFQVTPEHVTAVLDRIRRAFERGETELMLTSFPSSFCSDSGRAIINAGAPPINKPKNEDKAAAEAREPEWLATLPAGARQVHDYWRANLKPGGFAFTARVINYPGGIPGDVGLFFSWPKSSMETSP
jgi:hypothetical protein